MFKNGIHITATTADKPSIRLVLLSTSFRIWRIEHCTGYRYDEYLEEGIQFSNLA
jgi:hypothetical protein